jgi:hypothetical protein
MIFFTILDLKTLECAKRPKKSNINEILLFVSSILCKDKIHSKQPTKEITSNLWLLRFAAVFANCEKSEILTFSSLPDIL